MTQEIVDVRWLPVRRGDIYCSPACGGKCTHAAFEQATDRAAKLARSLGPGWKPRVWENLGWHYSVVNGVANLHPSHYPREKVNYTIFFNAATQIVVHSYDTDPPMTPRELVRTAASQAKELADSLTWMAREMCAGTLPE